MTETAISHEVETKEAPTDVGADLRLVRAWLDQGDRLALNTLLGRYLRPIRRFVFEMVLDHSAADDLTQDVFLRAIRGLPAFEGRAKFSTWLFQIARNVACTYLERRPPIATRSSFSTESDRRPAGPDQSLLSDETIGRVEAALRELSPRLRAAVVLVALHGTSTDEAAAIEGCEVGTIYSRLHEARKQLRHKLKELL